MDESTFVKIVTRAARAQYPALSGPQAFTKLFCDDSPEGESVRAAHAIVKRAAIGGAAVDETPPEEGDVETDDADALEELERLAAAERRRNPNLSKAVAFTKVYTDPANVALAKRERAQNRPRA
jgi:hypothetical protein